MIRVDDLGLGQLLTQKRMLLGLTQGKLGRKLGRSAATISSWESETRTPPASAVPDVSLTLRIDRRRLVRLIMRAAQNAR